ncbi:hypothetical protein LTR37_009735 [Vermiconidia calcicola]|uniref:Uncharacterized protein n=1 Tax=Vermiconidia calcicola TaxID=1690605 RepID=A0ACC3N7N3_9PEZI|nr:hypothetical protein LTR37_009735 [Vermiconidia calcicola]
MDDSTQGVDTPSSIEHLSVQDTDANGAPIVKAPRTTISSSMPREPAKHFGDRISIEGEVGAGAKRKHGLGDSESIEVEAGAVGPKRQRRAKPASRGITLDNGRLQLGTFLEQRVEDRMTDSKPLNEHSPRNLVENAIVAHEGASRAGSSLEKKEGISAVMELRCYPQALRRLSKKKLTPVQTARLATAKTFGPNYLVRTASLTNGHKFETDYQSSKGFTTQRLMMPAADTLPDQAVHAHLTGLTQGELLYMAGQHLKWTDMNGDELLSYSKDLVFVIIHALNRYHQGQGGVAIHFLDRRTAKDVTGEPAAFYPALDIYEALEVPKWEGWADPCKKKLRARKFTQEFLSHGTIKVEDVRFKEAPIEDLIADGLFGIFPELRAPTQHKRAGLYTGQVVSRKAGYPSTSGNRTSAGHQHLYSYTSCSRAVPSTLELLEVVQKLARNSMNVPPGRSRDAVEPHLHIFLCWLSLHKRLVGDPIFLAWIKEHYKPADVIDLYDDGHGGVQPRFIHVASNLPGVMQYIDLTRDCCSAFGLPVLPATVVEEQNALTGEWYADDDARLQQNKKMWVKYDVDDQARSREKAKKARRTKLAIKTGIASTEERPAGHSDTVGVGSTDDGPQLRDEVLADGTGIMSGAGSREASNDGTIDTVAPEEGHDRGTAAVPGASMLERLLARA